MKSIQLSLRKDYGDNYYVKKYPSTSFRPIICSFFVKDVLNTAYPPQEITLTVTRSRRGNVKLQRHSPIRVVWKYKKDSKYHSTYSKLAEELVNLFYFCERTITVQVDIKPCDVK